MITHPVDGVVHTWHRKSWQGGLEAVEQRSASRKHLHKTLEIHEESIEIEQRNMEHEDRGVCEGGEGVLKKTKQSYTFTSQTLVDVVIFP